MRWWLPKGLLACLMPSIVSKLSLPSFCFFFFFFFSFCWASSCAHWENAYLSSLTAVSFFHSAHSAYSYTLSFTISYLKVFVRSRAFKEDSIGTDLAEVPCRLRFWSIRSTGFFPEQHKTCKQVTFATLIYSANVSCFLCFIFQDLYAGRCFLLIDHQHTHRLRLDRPNYLKYQTSHLRKERQRRHLKKKITYILSSERIKNVLLKARHAYCTSQSYVAS